MYHLFVELRFSSTIKLVSVLYPLLAISTKQDKGKAMFVSDTKLKSIIFVPNMSLHSLGIRLCYTRLMLSSQECSTIASPQTKCSHHHANSKIMFAENDYRA